MIVVLLVKIVCFIILAFMYVVQYVYFWLKACVLEIVFLRCLVAKMGENG